MILNTLWGLRWGETVPELMVAWDEYSVDENYEGFKADCERAIASWGNDLMDKRYLEIEVYESAISKAFEETRIEGKVK